MNILRRATRTVERAVKAPVRAAGGLVRSPLAAAILPAAAITQAVAKPLFRSSGSGSSSPVPAPTPTPTPTPPATTPVGPVVNVPGLPPGTGFPTTDQGSAANYPYYLYAMQGAAASQAYAPQNQGSNENTAQTVLGWWSGLDSSQKIMYGGAAAVLLFVLAKGKK